MGRAPRQEGALEGPRAGQGGWTRQSEGYLVRSARAGTQAIVASMWALGLYSGPDKNVRKVSFPYERFFCLALAWLEGLSTLVLF